MPKHDFLNFCVLSSQIVVFAFNKGTIMIFDEEVAYDSHYSFRISKDDAEKLFGNKETYLHNLMKDFLKSNTGENLKELLEPYIFERISYY